MWTIQVLGGLSAHSPQRQLSRFRTQKAASLLAYLALHPAPQSRETLIDMLWPEAEMEAGRHNLSNALSFLRHILEPPGVPPGTVVLADRATVRLNPAAVTVDAVEFESELGMANMANLSEDERPGLLQQALERYQGALLPGFYEEWIASEALRLEGLFVQGVVTLVPLLLQVGKGEQAMMYAQRAVSADPLSEAATHTLMQAFWACGQPEQVLRAYRQLGRRLQEGLDTKPTLALQHLAEQLGQSGPELKTDLAVGGLPAETAAVFSRSSPTGAELPATSPASEGGMSRGRLMGAEFLLRTTTRFFGREEEVARLSRMLSTPRTRLVTLTGSGGTGKTRLALEVAAHLVEGNTATPLEDAPTSAVFVPLVPVTEPDRLFEVILHSLGIVPVSNQQPLDQLVSTLEAHPHTLLVLDNFEQLVGRGALHVHALLGKAASVKLLVTSRQRLHIAGEHEFHLAPLPTSSGAQILEAMLGVPSVALFVDRAQGALPDFQLTERNAATITQLCDYLEGLPLAIELAAARVALLSPARILEQVQANRLDFLATRRRDAESRQKTLRATLDWSYTLLPEAARAFLAALSAFRGGWTLEAAAAVCALSEEETLELLTLLRDSSLIQVSDTEVGLRFTLLETIREYGKEKLQDRGEDSAVRRRHRDYFVEYLKQAVPELSGPNQALWLNCLQLDHDNLCAAIEWSETDQTSAQVGLWLTAALSRFWNVRGYLSLGCEYLAKALSRADASAPTLERAKALQGAGLLARSQGDFASARALMEESLTIEQRLGDKSGVANSLDTLGTVARNQGDYGAARTWLEKSLAIWREIGNKKGIASSLNNLGILAYHQSNYGAARTVWEESLAIRRELGDRGGIPGSLNNLANVACDQGDYVAAQALYEEALVINREIGNRDWQAINLNNLGAVALRQGDFASARTFHEQSLAIRRELGVRDGIADSLNSLGDVTKDQGDYVAAHALYEEALVINRETGNRAWQAMNLNNLGAVAYAQGDYDAARTLLQESLVIHRELGSRKGIVYSLEGFAAVIAADPAAVTVSVEAQEVSRDTGDGMRKAARLWGAAETLREELGSPLSPKERDQCDSRAAAAREALGDSAFAAAWEEGRAMTLDEVVAYALAKGPATS